RAATFITELIREATPVKRPDIANPYQTASPVKPANPPTKKPARKPRAAHKQPPPEEKNKQPEMSMQAIIEATLPKVCFDVLICTWTWELTGWINAIREVK